MFSSFRNNSQKIALFVDLNECLLSVPRDIFIEGTFVQSGCLWINFRLSNKLAGSDI